MANEVRVMNAHDYRPPTGKELGVLSWLGLAKRKKHSAEQSPSPELQLTATTPQEIRAALEKSQFTIHATIADELEAERGQAPEPFVARGITLRRQGDEQVAFMTMYIQPDPSPVVTSGCHVLVRHETIGRGDKQLRQLKILGTIPSNGPSDHLAAVESIIKNTYWPPESFDGKHPPLLAQERILAIEDELVRQFAQLPDPTSSAPHNDALLYYRVVGKTLQSLMHRVGYTNAKIRSIGGATAVDRKRYGGQ